MFAENHIEFTSISGSYEERFQKAVVEVEKLFTEKEVVEVVEVAEVDKGYFVWDCKIKAKTQSSLMRIDDSPRIEVLRAMTGACLQIVNYFVSITDNWNCKVVVRNDIGLPNGFDLPPRRAAIDAVENFGVEIIECASGWGGTLSPSQEEIIRRSL
jgi:citrate lyase gamma subunit